jgi:hypothetical protein
VTAYLNTQARLRLVAAVAAPPSFSRVSMTAGDTVLGANVLSSTIRSYVLVNSGSVTLHTSVDGTSLADKAITATAGADMTLLVSGSSAADAMVSVINDDNRLPTVSAQYKIRLIHAAPSRADQNLSMTVDATDVVSDLAFGSASAYADQTATGAATIDISTPTEGTIYTLTDQALLSKGVYTVFMFDSSTGPRAQLKKER